MELKYGTQVEDFPCKVVVWATMEGTCENCGTYINEKSLALMPLGYNGIRNAVMGCPKCIPWLGGNNG